MHTNDMPPFPPPPRYAVTCSDKFEFIPFCDLTESPPPPTPSDRCRLSYACVELIMYSCAPMPASSSASDPNNRTHQGTVTGCELGTASTMMTTAAAATTTAPAPARMRDWPNPATQARTPALLINRQKLGEVWAVPLGLGWRRTGCDRSGASSLGAPASGLRRRVMRRKFHRCKARHAGVQAR